MSHNHDEHGPTREPMDVVLDWWQAIQDNNIPGLAEILHDDYIATGGPAGRTIGTEFTLSGLATDVLTRGASRWTISSHHTSVRPAAEGNADVAAAPD